jgi:hypothetical protein
MNAFEFVREPYRHNTPNSISQKEFVKQQSSLSHPKK